MIKKLTMDYRCGRYQNFKTKRQGKSPSPSFPGRRKYAAVNKQQKRVESRAWGSIIFSPMHCVLALLMHIYETITEPIRCLLRIICQEKQVQIPTRTPKHSSIISSSRRNRQIFLQSLQTQQSLYSSDEEGSDNDDDETLLRTGDIPVDLIGDHEIPFVRQFDYFVYLWNLATSNFPAFVHAARTSVNNWGESDRPFSVPQQQRPRIVKFAVDALKRRELKRRMTRVKLDDHKKWLLQWALASRVIIFFMQAVAVNLLQVFKHENDGFKFTPEEDYGKLLDPFVNTTFGGYINWDANYFLHISVNGYTSENMLAFFPLLPLILYIPSRIVHFLVGYFISLSSTVTVLGVIFNTWLFVKCADNIYELSKMWSRGSQQLVTAAGLFFVFNPASIFFAGLYTETLFLYLTSQVILCLFDRQYWNAILFAGLSGLCRSNGILNVGFIAAFSLQQQLLNDRRIFKFFTFVGSSILQALLCSIPFLMFQGYGIHVFCDGREATDFDQIPVYCIGSSKWGLPVLPYSYVQSKYWNVGFLRYFQVKQIPNFILALPVLYTLGQESSTALKETFLCMKTNFTWCGLYFALQACHGIFLTFFCFFFVHVQVSTRMIMAACPYLYIYMADSYLLDVERFRKNEIDLPICSQLVMLWCAIYFILGSIGFALGLPWT